MIKAIGKNENWSVQKLNEHFLIFIKDSNFALPLNMLIKKIASVQKNIIPIYSHGNILDSFCFICLIYKTISFEWTFRL